MRFSAHGIRVGARVFFVNIIADLNDSLMTGFLIVGFLAKELFINNFAVGAG